MKNCTKCKIEKPLSAFEKQKRGKFGLRGQCKTCRAQYFQDNKIRFRERSKRNMALWLKNNPDQALNTVLVRNYGITAEIYKSLLCEQGGTCKICSRATTKRLAVDHCHETGVVRGLLCTSCNTGLGLFAERPELLVKAAAYLRAVA